MGYRQDYKFIVVGARADLEKVVEYIEEIATYPVQEPIPVGPDFEQAYGIHAWAAYFLERLTWLKHENAQHTDRYALFFEDNAIKAYGSFDSLVNDIIEVSSKFNCQATYAHVGDDFTDTVIKGEGGDVYIGISRTINEPDW